MAGKSKYSLELREKIAKEAIETGRVKAVADRYQVDPTLAYSWVRAYKKKGATESTKTIRQYQKQIEDQALEIEVLRELLKKTTNVLIKE